MSENDWLAWRKTGVESVNEKETSTLVLRWGHALEETVVQEFSYKTDLRVYQMPEMYQHPIYPFMQGNIDRFIDFPDGTRGILECKTGKIPTPKANVVTANFTRCHSVALNYFGLKFFEISEKFTMFF